MVFGLRQDAVFQFLKKGVIRQITVSMRHDVSGILLSFDHMTGLTIFWADHYMNAVIVVVKSIGMGFGSEHVAFGTTDHNVLQVFGNSFTGHLAG